MQETKLKYVEQTVTSHCDITYVLICGKCIVIKLTILLVVVIHGTCLNIECEYSTMMTSIVLAY